MLSPENVAANLTDEQIATFLGSLAEGRTASGSARIAGRPRPYFYVHKKNDPNFSAAWDEAETAGTEFMEDEARRRAVEGVDKPIYHQGVRVDTVREFSDTLLIFLLKGRKPETYRDNSNLKITGTLTLGQLIEESYKGEDGKDV
jgi:hypothetical protein